MKLVFFFSLSFWTLIALFTFNIAYVKRVSESWWWVQSAAATQLWFCMWVWIMGDASEGPPGVQSKHLSVSPLHRLSEYVNDHSIFSCVNTLVISHICLDFRPWRTTVTDRHYHHQSEKLFSSANSACIKTAWIINNWIILCCAIHSPLFSLFCFARKWQNVLECGIWSNLLQVWKRQKVHTR